jgi:hypothetical protein
MRSLPTLLLLLQLRRLLPTLLLLLLSYPP